MEKKKKHADFQDDYHKSSNFGKAPEEEKLKIKGDGKLKIEKDKENKSKKENKESSDALQNGDSEEE